MKKDNVKMSKKEKNETVKILDLSKKNDRKEFKKEIDDMIKNYEIVDVIKF